MNEKNQSVNIHFQNGMWADSLPSMQKEGCYPYMLNGQHEYFGGNSFGVCKEQSLEFVLEVEPGMVLIQEWYQDEKDRFIVFLYHTLELYSEIGYLNIQTKSYTKVINDKDWHHKWDFSCNKLINVELKPLKQNDGCYHDILYFSSNGWTYKINLDNHCDLTYEDTLLFQGGCIDEIKTYRIENGGEGGHKCGIVQYYAALIDVTDNRSNFFGPSEPLRIYSEDNIAGQNSNDAVLIKIPGNTSKYSHIQIVVAFTIEGSTKYFELVTLPYPNADFEYLHLGNETLIPIDGLEVNTLRPGYFRNWGLRSKDNHLILYKMMSDHNPDLYDMVGGAEVYWVLAEIDAKYAKDIPTLPKGELLSLGAVVNYKDGTNSAVQHIFGRASTPDDRMIVKAGTPDLNCTECDLQKWQVQNTAYVTDEYCISRAPLTIVTDENSEVSQQLVLQGLQAIRSEKLKNKKIFVLDPGKSVWEKVPDDNSGCYQEPGNPQTILDNIRSILLQCTDCVPDVNIQELLDQVLPGNTFGSCTGCGKSCNKDGTCSGGCGGGGCAGGSCGGSSTGTGDGSDPDTEGKSTCEVHITYFKARFNCTYCDIFEGYGTFNNLQTILGPDYTVVSNTVSDGTTPCSYYPCIQIACGGNIQTVSYTHFATDAQVQDLIYGLCPCGDHEGTGGNSDGKTEGGGGCKGKGQSCSKCGNDNCQPTSTGVGCTQCTEYPVNVSGHIAYGKYKCLDCGNDSETSTCSCGGEAAFCITCGGSLYRLLLTPPGLKEVPVTDSDIALSAAFDLEDCPDGEPIYDSLKKCRILGYNPVVVKRGKMGYWESLEDYPDIKDCNGKYYYRGNAKSPIRHHLLPDETLIANHITSQTGVVSDAMPNNIEYGKTKVYVLGLEIRGLKLPGNLPKPVCEENPISIVCQPIGGRIQAKGMLTHTFLGQTGSTDLAVPKNGTNSLELYSRNIDDIAGTLGAHFRGGGLHGLPIYNFHSPETNFRHAPLRIDRAMIPWEIFGPGVRYGLYAEGVKHGSIWDTALNYKGYRGAVNLNHYTSPKILVDPGNCLEIINFVVEIDACGMDIFKGKGDNTITAKLRIFNTSQRVIRMDLDVIQQTVLATKSVQNTTELNIRQRIPKGTRPSFQIEVRLVLEDALDGSRCNYVYKGVAKTIVFDPRFPENAECILIWEDNMVSTDYRPPRYEDRTQYRCLKDYSYVDTDKIFNRSGKFTYGLDNSYREKSVYLEFEGEQLTLQNSIDKYLLDNRYNGNLTTGLGLAADNTCDSSLLGDIQCHFCPIHMAAAHYAVLINDNPKQYGRLENAVYIKLGMEVSKQELLLENIRRVGIGNHWIGLYSHRRFGYLSDKVGSLDDQLKKEIDPITILGIPILDFANIFCLYDCAAMPLSCADRDTEDARKKNGLRNFNYQCWDGSTGFNGYTARDIYHPNTFNQINHFWVESKVNLWRRQTGVCEPLARNITTNTITATQAEVHYDNLKCLQLDPEFRKGSDWLKSFLTRHGMRWPRIGTIKKIIRTVLKIVILFFIIKIAYNLFASLDIEIFGTKIPVGSIIVAGIIIALLTVSILNKLICRFLDKVIDIDACIFYCYSNGFNCKEEDSKLLPIEDNYTKYNYILSFMNKLRYYLAPGLNYDTCECKEIINKQVYSDVQNLESSQDSWQNFRPNNYALLDVKYGLITDLFEYGNDLYAHTSEQVLRLFSAVTTLNSTEGREIILGEGNFLNRAIPVAMGIPEGWGGTLDEYASKSSKFGRFFIDREDRGIYSFQGMPKPVSNNGFREFMKENGGIIIKQQFPEFDRIGYQVDFVGYTMGFDPRLNRMIISKIDYQAIHPEKIRYFSGLFYDISEKEWQPIKLTDPNYFRNVSWKISRNLINDTWISWHDSMPTKYLNDRTYMYSFKDGKLWRHSSSRTFLNHYGIQREWVVDIYARMANFMAFRFKRLVIDTEAMYYIDDLPVRSEDFFTHFASWNSYQSTGIVNVEIVKEAKKNGHFIDNHMLRSTGKIVNKVDDQGFVEILTKKGLAPGILYNLNSLVIKDLAANNSTFFDKYQGFRLICAASATEKVNIVLKFVVIDGEILV